ncbi:MAG: serine hydrolase domain-containing protein [Pyramidobacter sp.]|jgi:CubicO group peptidase (beta-lactamase class C family)
MNCTERLKRRFESGAAALKDYLEKIMATHDARGMAVAVIDAHDTVLQDFLGLRDAERGLPIDENTLFGLASVTKSFTALSVMQLVERGAVDLCAPLADSIPEFHNLHQKTVTAAHFLSHTGGYYPRPRALLSDLLKKLSIDASKEEVAYDDRVAQAAVEEVASGLDADEPRLAAPGRMMSYCNDGYGLLSDLIRRKGGEGSYAAWVDKHILEPLGMKRSTCRFLAPSQDANAAKLYTDHSADWDYTREAFVLNGGGAMKSTLADMKKYLRMYLNRGAFEGGRLVSAESVAMMVQPRVATKFGTTYGFGLMTTQMGDLTVHRHGGSLPGVSSHIAWSPELGAAAIVLCNTENVPVGIAADALLRVAAGWPVEAEDRWIDEPWDDDVIRRACGTYRSGEGACLIIGRKGKGISVLDGGKKVSCRTVRGARALLTRGMAVSEVHLLFDGDGEVYAVRLNDRVIPRIQER